MAQQLKYLLHAGEVWGLGPESPLINARWAWASLQVIPALEGGGRGVLGASCYHRELAC